MNNSRITTLDGLRGLATLLVLMFHSFMFQHWDNIPYAPLLDWMWIGLDIFFVLSGYLITSILLRSLHKPGYFKNFYLRRVFRIFPAYYGALLIYFVVFPHLSDQFAHSPTRDTAWMYVLYVQNWVFGIQGWPDWHGFAHVWSMAVEEQYYMVWPLLVLLCGPKRLPMLCVGIMAIAVAGKLAVAFYAHGQYLMLSYTSTLTRMDGIAAGSLLALIKPEQVRRLLPWIKCIALAGMALVLLTMEMHRTMRAEFLTGTAGAILLSVAAVACVHGDISVPRFDSFFTWRPFVWLGVRSYSIYLMHYPVQHVVWEYYGPEILKYVVADPLITPLIVTAASVALFCVMGMPLYYLVELPMMRMREHLPAVRARFAAILPRRKKA